MSELASEPSTQRGTGPQRVALGADDAGRGLGQLVLAVLDVLRQLLERQAVRRVESGSLTDEEIERLGTALLRLEEQFDELRDVFTRRQNDGGDPSEPGSRQR